MVSILSQGLETAHSCFLSWIPCDKVNKLRLMCWKMSDYIESSNPRWGQPRSAHPLVDWGHTNKPVKTKWAGSVCNNTLQRYYFGEESLCLPKPGTGQLLSHYGKPMVETNGRFADVKGVKYTHYTNEQEHYRNLSNWDCVFMVTPTCSF